MADAPDRNRQDEPAPQLEYERRVSEDAEAPPAPDPLRPLHPPLPHPRSSRTILDYARERDPEAEQRERRRLEAARQRLDEPAPPMTGGWRHVEGVVLKVTRLVLLVLLAMIIFVAVMMVWRAG